LRELGKIATLEEIRESFLFAGQSNDTPFEFHCVIVHGGIDVSRTGQYFEFLGIFLEALTGEFGPVVLEDA
jgi:hypothetical protein